MNILHYLYTKGETVLNYRLNGRSFIVFPIYLITLFFAQLLLPKGINEFVFILFCLCWFGILYALTYIVIPKKKVKLKTWSHKYNKTTSLWAYIYLFSPSIMLLTYVIIKFG